ncbi:unnamed protein product, partial [Allacma fusca]
MHWYQKFQLEIALEPEDPTGNCIGTRRSNQKLHWNQKFQLGIALEPEDPLELRRDQKFPLGIALEPEVPARNCIGTRRSNQKLHWNQKIQPKIALEPEDPLELRRYQKFPLGIPYVPEDPVELITEITEDPVEMHFNDRRSSGVGNSTRRSNKELHIQDP